MGSRSLAALISAFACLGVGVGRDIALPSSPTPTDIEAIVQKIVEEKASKYNCTIAVSVKVPTLNNGIPISAAAGYVDIPNAVPASRDDVFVWGSITKMSTGAAILKMVENKRLGLDEPIYPYCDAMLTKMKSWNPKQNFSSIAELFGNESRQVTVRQAATMMSGIPDFDTAKPFPWPPTDTFRAAVYENPEREYGPADLLSLPWVATGSLDFTPGTKTRYSSSNFVLLGLVLASLSGADNWDLYEQSSFLPPDVHKLMRSTRYATHGAPRNWTRVRGYDRTSYNGHDPKALPGLDVYDVSGVYSGWSASDFTSSVHDAAEFVYALYGPQEEIISKEFIDVMIPKNEFYGFATFNLTRHTGQTGKYGTAVGHLGATYGYDSILAYMPGADFSVAVASNMENDDQIHPADAFCSVYNEVKNRLTGERTKCKFIPGGYYTGGCKCTDS